MARKEMLERGVVAVVKLGPPGTGGFWVFGEICEKTLIHASQSPPADPPPSPMPAPQSIIGSGIQSRAGGWADPERPAPFHPSAQVCPVGSDGNFIFKNPDRPAMFQPEESQKGDSDSMEGEEKSESRRVLVVGLQHLIRRGPESENPTRQPCLPGTTVLGPGGG